MVRQSNADFYLSASKRLSKSVQPERPDVEHISLYTNFHERITAANCRASTSVSSA
ncbi:MAG: hypothetical protein ACKVUS_16165 [Saprospiraceae bacterium]